MNKMKRIFSLVLVLTMVLGSFGSVFAVSADEVADKELTAVPKDVIGTEYEKAVSRLVAFGILEGYPDGTYQPEKDITRAEFAKILVEALGLGSAANAAVGKTNFSDVTASHWAAGYMNVASGQGLIKGYPDGTFKPSKQVSYAEALTMLVRALGYQDSFLGVKGANWAQAYTAKAAQLGISSGVKFVPNSYAQRGTVAILVDNTLDTDIIKQVKYGDKVEWEEQTITLLKERLDIDKLEELVVTGTPRVLKGIEKDQIRVEFEKDIKYTDAIRDARKDIKYEKGEVEVFDVTEKVDLEALGQKLGESLNIYVNDDDEVVYFEESNRPFRVIYDTIDGEENEYKDNKLELINEDRSYDIQEETKDLNAAVFYLDNEEVSQKKFVDEAEEASKASKHLFAKVVLNRRGNIKLVDAYKWEGNPGVVIEADKEQVVYFVDDEDDEKKIKLKDYDKLTVFDMEGNVLGLEDIKKDDVIYLNDKDLDGDDLEEASSKDEVAYVLVVRNKVEGKFQSYRGNSEVEIDGKNYDIIGGNITTVSIDNDATINIYAEAHDDLDDLSGEEAEVVALLDASGDVRHIRGGIESSSGALYGVVTGVDSKYGDIYAKILNYDEKTVEYELDLDDVYGYKDQTDKTLKANRHDVVGDGVRVSTGDIVRYKVNSNGDIKEIELIAYHDGSDFVAASKADKSDKIEVIMDKADSNYDIAKKSIRLEKEKKFAIVKDDVAVFNYTPALDKNNKLEDAADVEYAKWEDIVDKSVKADTKVVLAMDSKRDSAELVVFLSNFDEIGDDSYVGYVTSIRKIDGDSYADIVYQGSDKVVRVELSDDKQYDKAGGFQRRNVAAFIEKSNGKVEAKFKNHKDLEVVTGKVNAVRGKYITIAFGEDKDAKTEVIRVDSDTVYYKKGNRLSSSDINEGDYIRAAIKEGIAGAVKKYDANEKDIRDGKEEAKVFYADFKFDMDKDWKTGTPGTPGAEEGKEVKGVFTFRGDTWITIEGTDYILPEQFDAKDYKAGTKVNFESKKFGDDLVITKIEVVEEGPVDPDPGEDEGEITATFSKNQLGMFIIKVDTTYENAKYYEVIKGETRLVKEREIDKETPLMGAAENDKIVVSVYNEAGEKLGEEEKEVKEVK